MTTNHWPHRWETVQVEQTLPSGAPFRSQEHRCKKCGTVMRPGQNGECLFSRAEREQLERVRRDLGRRALAKVVVLVYRHNVDLPDAVKRVTAVHRGAGPSLRRQG